MTDREKLLDGLNKIREFFEARADMAVGDGKLLLLNWANTARDALELLNEQEPIPCGEKIKAGDVMLDFYECGHCKNAIRKPWRYCPFCGKEVKWNA